MSEPRNNAPPPQPADTEPARRPEPPRKPGPSRIGGAWMSAVLGAIVLILLLIFVLQNLGHVNVSFAGANGRIPLGVALLLSAVAGALIVAVPGSARIVQLRRANRSARRALSRST
ncbi:hypothetical protein GCM10022251_56640 [Phytohabitans flavus]|uniref:Lipopolysaccharide assembly protein A domain-containing protein n=1 Tax=Phytohabitans flavus TaxID=1076124 RepID=A0A6F8XQJ2_9ACTN|nr:lipopolysaccharide assembly protein LapA domain-containing protein [Phytohabitans flavus]BCB76090.1 hypothetical protein Pflav_025000 [Phytohabitans flavus]